MKPNPRHFTQVILIMIFIALAISLSGCDAVMTILNRGSGGASSVVFKVTGSGDKAVITYTRPNGTTTIPTTVKLPWRSDTMNFQPGSVLVITAAGETDESKIECSILVNGVVINSNQGDPSVDKATCGYATHN